LRYGTRAHERLYGHAAIAEFRTTRGDSAAKLSARRCAEATGLVTPTTVTRRIVSVTNPANAVLVGQAPSASGTDLGWTAGGGVDWGFARNWSAGLEYRYMQVDTSRNYVYSLSGADRSNQSTDHLHTIRATVNFHFN
jgi:opacity protein-like surface antigen